MTMLITCQSHYYPLHIAWSMPFTCWPSKSDHLSCLWTLHNIMPKEGPKLPLNVRMACSRSGHSTRTEIKLSESCKHFQVGGHLLRVRVCLLCTNGFQAVWFTYNMSRKNWEIKVVLVWPGITDCHFEQSASPQMWKNLLYPLSNLLVAYVLCGNTFCKPIIVSQSLQLWSDVVPIQSSNGVAQSLLWLCTLQMWFIRLLLATILHKRHSQDICNDWFNTDFEYQVLFVCYFWLLCSFALVLW